MAELNGRDISDYVDEVNELIRNGRTQEAESLLLELVDATESQDTEGVAPWYYERLAVIYRKRGEPDREIAILERYAASPIAPGKKPQKLIERLHKAYEGRNRSRLGVTEVHQGAKIDSVVSENVAKSERTV